MSVNLLESESLRKKILQLIDCQNPGFDLVYVKNVWIRKHCGQKMKKIYIERKCVSYQGPYIAWETFRICANVKCDFWIRTTPTGY